MTWENSFLNWFARQGIPTSERSATLGTLQYFQFTSAFEGTHGKRMHAFGCSPVRETAAVKCAAEAIERKFMDEFYQSPGTHAPDSSIEMAPYPSRSLKTENLSIPPKGMQTSNGWAVHSSRDRASSAASLEAMERHLLIKSFYRWGWQGFRFVQEMQSDEMRLFFLTSRLTSAGHIAGIIAAKSPLYPGVAFGYCAGKVDRVQDTLFWQSALFEAVSRIQSLGGRTIEIREPSNAWLQGEAKYYLETPFDLELLQQGAGQAQEEEGTPSCVVNTFDLARSWKLDFPLAAAFCWGGNLIPLCNQALLDETGRKYFESTLLANDLPPNVPARHPIL